MRAAAAAVVCATAAVFLPVGLIAAAFLAGLLFGGMGAVGAALGALAGGGLVDAGPSSSIGLAAAVAVAAVVPYAIFRQVAGIGRGLPNLRSYCWLLGAGALSAVSAAAVLYFVRGGGSLLVPWIAAFEGLTAVAFAAPLATIAVDLHARHWMAPIAGELPARRGLAIDDFEALDPIGTGSVTRILAPPRRGVRPEALLALAGIVAFTALVVPVMAVLPAGGAWLLLGYLVPVFWAASRYGMRGALAAASSSALVFAAGHALWIGSVSVPAAAELSGDATLAWRSAYAELVLFGLVGAFAGTAGEREQALRTEVVHRNQLLRKDLLRVVQALTAAVEAKDVYTEGHLRRVSHFAVRVGELLGLQGSALEMVFFASMLHDIGKIGVPEAVLTKPGPLTAAETRLMQRHAEAGARILESLDVLREAAPLVLHHQERWDGLRTGPYPGYPAGLAGEEIPLGSRIIAVVDAFDAMTTDRPYRKALPLATAIDELRREAGKQFDPRVVEVFLSELEESPWAAEVA